MHLRFLVSIRRREQVAEPFDDRVRLVIDLLLGDGEHLLEVAVDRLFEHFVALDRFQVVDIDADQRRRRQHDRQRERQR